MIADPDGNSVELFAPLPVGEVPGDTPIPGGDSAA
jgi:hypothetical protein